MGGALMWAYKEVLTEGDEKGSALGLRCEKGLWDQKEVIVS